MQAKDITGVKEAESAASTDPAASSTTGVSRPPASRSTVRAAVKKIQDQQLEILQDALRAYHDIGGAIRVENVVVGGKPGVVALLPGVFFCAKCGNFSRGAVCLKCRDSEGQNEHPVFTENAQS